MINVDNKFEVGEIVKVKGTAQRFMIEQVLTVTCTAGSQTLYEGNLLFPRADYSLKKGEFILEPKLFRVNEICLEKIEVKKPIDLEDPKLKEMLAEYKKYKEEKNKEIKNQDFEKAASWRDKERIIKDLITSMYDVDEVRELLQ